MRLSHPLFVLLFCLALALAPAEGADWISFDGKAGVGQGKHVVLIAGDEEYRSEEGLPLLAKILSQRHGFKCTVLFSVNEEGVIDPDNQKSLSGAENLDSADAIVMLLRFRNWPDKEMKHFVDAFKRGVPIVGLRTSTHAFQMRGASSYKEYSSFGKRVLGEGWVSHWGRHKREATSGVLEESAKDHPILRGVEEVFGDTDVYEAYPPDDATILLWGRVLEGMKPGDPPADYVKRRASDKQEQGVNDPMMPVAWTRIHTQESGTSNRIFNTTMGSSTDLQSEGLRRLVVNAVYWGLDMEVPAKADVSYVGSFKPTAYGFGSYKKGVKPSDHLRLEEPLPTAALPLQLKKGDHIAFIGNSVADRMQHTGTLEAMIHAAFPDHDLVIRNLAVTGDELTVRHRSENFGSAHSWLEKTKADVIFAFFGFNESFRGYAGLEKFREDLQNFIKETRALNYSGKGSPQIVLFSPLAAERNQDPNFPDPESNNTNLQNYTSEMATVAEAMGVPFVNLYDPSAKLFRQARAQRQSLTINGIHLSEAGDQALAPEIFQALFRKPAPEPSHALRAAVQEKNRQWHARYRTVDGYNVYGGRSALQFPSGQSNGKISNFDVMQEEMSQRDWITANRDREVWAAANGRTFRRDDSGIPKVTPVPTNKRGANEDGSFPFISGEAAISKMKIHPGMEVNLFASEEEFPELVNPVQMAWDTKNRLWVAAWPNYPERTPESKVGDSLLVFEDTDGDGKADKCTHFLDDLNAPTGFQFYKDGVLVMQAPDFWFVRDTDGDGKGDWKQRMLMGIDSADSHHTANAIALDPGGAVYLSDGVFHRTQVETASGPVRNDDGAIFRFEPRTGKFERYVAYGFANPHGKVFDRWGNDIITDATGNANYFGPAFSGRIDYPSRHPGMNQFWSRPSRPCAGTTILSSRHFPDEFQGNFLNCNVISFQGIFRVGVTEEGSGLKGETLEHLISSDDVSFRPTDVRVGPDGAIYFLDWHNPIIGHMQHHIRDPNRDHRHGRIYRITHQGRPLLQPKPIDGAPIVALLDLLKEPENGTRELAKIELGERDTEQVMTAVAEWMGKLDKKEEGYEHHMMEALWVHQWHNVVNPELLDRMLDSPEPRARAAATRVLCYWRDRVSQPLARLKRLAEDPHPRVRLEAVRAASFFDEVEAAEVALASLKQPTDYYLNYTLGETMRQLEPLWKEAVAQGKPIASDNPAGVDYLLASVRTEDLKNLPQTPGVLQAILTRPGLTDADRGGALYELAEKLNKDSVTTLLNLLDGAQNADAAANLARLLAWQNPDELKAARDRVGKLTEKARSPEVRAAGWACLSFAEDSFEQTWQKASTDPSTTTDFLMGIPMLNDPSFRAKAFSRVLPLLSDTPAAWNLDSKKSFNNGRFVRIELPRRGTLTLAEVQVFSDGKNIAPSGSARQSTTSHGGDAKRAIDGLTDGSYSSGTQTHTAENSPNPWWELDLGSEKPVESVTIWNRTEGALRNRLEGFTLTILNGSRGEVFKQTDNPAPEQNISVAVNADPVGAMRRAAITALVSMGTEHAATFSALTKLLTRGEQMSAAARGLRVIPPDAWPAADAGKAARALTQWAKSVPASNRTSQDYIEAVQAASALAGLLPAAEAELIRNDLRELRVAVFVLRAVREQMRFDSARLVVEAGKPFEIILENDDFMPHNLAIVKPGSRARVGTLSDKMKPDELDSRGRAYVPQSSDILEATSLLEPGSRATLKMTAPSVEGDYEYVCTFPTHWMLMWGKLVVTKDVDAYLRAHPVPEVRTANAGRVEAQL